MARPSTKQKIVDAATGLILEKGVKATTLRDVAEAADISPGTLTYHFSSREALFFDVLIQHMGKQDDQMMKIFAIEDSSVRRNMLSKFLNSGHHNLVFMELHYYLMGCSVAKDSELYLPMREKFNQWKNQFKAIVPHAAEKTPAQLEADAQLVYAMLNGFSMGSLYNDGSFNPQDMADRLVDILERM